MITLFHKTYRNPDKESSPYLPAILLGCVFVLMPLGISAQNAPAGPIGAGASSDQAPAAQTQTPAASSDAHPNLAGTWQLNKKQSDDPREKMQEARNEQGNGGRRVRRRGRQRNGQRPPGPRTRRRYDERVLAAHYHANEFNGQSDRRIRARPCSLLKRRSIAKFVRGWRFEQV